MYKYKLYFNESVNDGIEILKQLKKHFPTWDCVSINNVDVDSKYTNTIIIVNNLTYVSSDRKSIDAVLEVLRYFFNSIGLTDYDITNDVEFNQFF